MKDHMIYMLPCCLALLFFSGCVRIAPPADAPVLEAAVPDSAEDVTPVLIGQALPSIVLKTIDGTQFDLNAAVSEKPAVLIFYRGGWCPYCSTHLSQLQSIESQLIDMGFQVMAISPDRPELLNKSVKKQDLKYRLLSDNDMNAAKALGIAFKLDDVTVAKYKSEYNIDIEADSGRTHHLLPVPAAFIVNRDGIITFTYVNPNYTVRIDPDVLLAAAGSTFEPENIK